MKGKLLIGITAAAVLTASSVFTASAAEFAKANTYTSGMFADVSESEWYASSIASSYELGFMKGTADTMFEPNGNMTVAEAITIAARVHDAYNAKGTQFSTGSANWYDDYVAYAVTNGIIEEGQFDDYNRPVKRWEMAVIFSKSVPESFLEARNSVDEIPDVPETNSYYDSLALLYNAGVVMGNDEFGTFMPNNNIIRAEAAAIINRVALPESRLQKALVDANYDDAYYLINDGSIRLTSGVTQSVSPWNYDNRNRLGVISNSADNIADYYPDGIVEIWRDIDNVSRGLIGWDFYGSMPLVGDGVYFKITDDTKHDIVSLNIKGGNWYVNSTDTGVAAETGYIYFSIKADLDNKTAALVLNGQQIGETFTVNDGIASRVYIGSGKETTSVIQMLRCDVYKDYPVNDIFLQPKGSPLSGWEVTGSAEVAYTGGQTYNDVNSAMMSAGSVAKETFNPISGSVVFESYMLFPEEADTGYVSLNSGDISVAKLELNADGVFTANGTKLRHHTNNVWQCLRIEADTVNGTVTYKVNGKVVGEMSLDAYAPTVDNITIGVTGGTAYFDDVKVFLTHEYDDYCPVPVPITDDGYDVVLNVCSLWHEGSHSGWGCESAYPDIEPALGYYDEGLAEVADWEIKFMVENGIDVQHLCWYCPSSDIKEPIKRSNLNWALHDGYFNAKYSDMMKFTFMWENNGVNVTNLEQFKEYIWKYWVEYYFLDDRFYTIDNKIVFTVWNYNNFMKGFGGTYEGCQEAIEFMNEDIKKYGFDGIMMFFADSHKTDAASFKSMSDMGGIAAYAYHWSQDGNSAEKSISRLQHNADLGQIHILPTVSVGFNNLGWSGVRKPMISVEEHREVLEYIKNDYLPKQEDGWKSKTLIISTWNEFGEGTYVMPCAGLHGFGYIENIAEVISGVTDHSSNIYPTAQQKERLCHLYPESQTTLTRWDLEDENQAVVPEKNVLEYTGADMENLFGLESYEIDGTVFKATTTATDCGIKVAADKKPNIAAADVVAIRITMKTSVSCDAELFFATNSTPITASTSYRFAAEASEDFKVYTIYTDANTNWTGTITDIRIDPVCKPGTFEVAKCEFLGLSDDMKPIEITVDGKAYEVTFAPEAEGDEVYVAAEPAVGFFSLHNFYFEWSRYTGRLYILTKNDREIVFNVGSDIALVDGTETKLAKPIELRDGLPVLPLFFIYDIAGIEYIYENKQITVYVSGKQYIDEINNRVPFEYEFNIPGDNEGFSAADATMAIYDGFMQCEALKREDNPNQPYDPRHTLSGINIPAAKYNKVVIGMKHKFADPSTETSKVEMFFITSSDASWNQEKSASADIVGNSSNEVIEYTIDFSDNSAWNNSITSIRFDPITCAGSYEVDYIRFVQDPSWTGSDEDNSASGTPAQATDYPNVENLVNGDAEDTDNVAFFNDTDRSVIEIIKDEESGSNVYRNIANTEYSYSRQSVKYTPGQKYNVSVDVKIIGKRTGETDIGEVSFHCNARYTDAEGKWDHIVYTAHLSPADGWTTLEFSFEIPEGVETHENDEFSFFSNPVDGVGVSYMFDNVKVTLAE